MSNCILHIVFSCCILQLLIPLRKPVLWDWSTSCVSGGTTFESACRKMFVLKFMLIYFRTWPRAASMPPHVLYDYSSFTNSAPYHHNCGIYRCSPPESHWAISEQQQHLLRNWCGEAVTWPFTAALTQSLTCFYGLCWTSSVAIFSLENTVAWKMPALHYITEWPSMDASEISEMSLLYKVYLLLIINGGINYTAAPFCLPICGPSLPVPDFAMSVHFTVSQANLLNI